MKTILTLIAFVTCFLYSHAQSINTSKLDSLFTVLEQRGMAKGSVAISQNGKPVYTRKVGTAGEEPLYRIGSVSKLFTATMVFKLVESKKLRLSDNLATWFPQLPNAQKITISQLLYHKSGLYDYTRANDYADWMDKSMAQEEMLEIITKKRPDFEPGTKTVYSNSNYLVLSYIIEKVNGSTYEEALQKMIIAKLSLKNTSYGTVIPTQSFKYAEGEWIKQTATHPRLHAGAGSIVSTPTDLTIFIQKLFDGKIIGRASLDSMTKITDGFGMGIFPYDYAGAKGYGHNGRLDEFYSAVRYYPERKLAVSYITNGILYPRIDILDRVLQTCFNESYDLPFAKREEDLAQYCGVYSGDVPFKVRCTLENGHLVVDAGGKKMEVEQIGAHYFMNRPQGTFFDFDASKGKLQIKETDNVYLLKK